MIFTLPLQERFYNVLKWCEKGDKPFFVMVIKRKSLDIGKHLYNVFYKRVV